MGSGSSHLSPQRLCIVAMHNSAAPEKPGPNSTIANVTADLETSESKSSLSSLTNNGGSCTLVEDKIYRALPVELHSPVSWPVAAPPAKPVRRDVDVYPLRKSAN